MALHAEDVYEDLDEADDEDIEDALGENDYSERRRRGRRARGGGYNKPRIEKSFATQAQLQQVSERIAKDVRALDANVKSLEATARRGQSGMNQSMQMMALLPLLTKKTIRAADVSAAANKDVKVVVDDGDTLTTMLPLMMMMMMPGGQTTGGQSGQMDPMMMMMMVLVLGDKDRTKSA